MSSSTAAGTAERIAEAADEVLQAVVTAEPRVPGVVAGVTDRERDRSTSARPASAASTPSEPMTDRHRLRDLLHDQGDHRHHRACS